MPQSKDPELLSEPRSVKEFSQAAPVEMPFEFVVA